MGRAGGESEMWRRGGLGGRLAAVSVRFLLDAVVEVAVEVAVGTAADVVAPPDR